MKPTTADTPYSIDFLGKRKFAVVFSIVVLLAGIVSVATHGGLNYGIDFRGGTNVQIRFGEAVDLDSLRGLFKEKNLGSVVLQTFGSETEHEVLLGLPVDSALGTGEDLTAQLRGVLGTQHPNLEIRRIETVGPRVGDELKEDALLAILVALALILLYVSFRFQWRQGVSAILTLVHDVLVVVSVFSLLDKEFTLPVVAALLTVVGYSLNDTIVVFDRIRENQGRFRKQALEWVMNLSITDTLSRTLLTSGTTLLVVVALLVLGGEIIFDFAFALLIGVLIGTYSSIYVASPLVLLLNKGQNPGSASAESKASVPEQQAS